MRKLTSSLKDEMKLKHEKRVAELQMKHGLNLEKKSRYLTESMKISAAN